MLRYFYFLSLLICIINLSFCYEYTGENVLSNRPSNRKSQHNANVRQRRRNVVRRKFRKRRDFDTEYDKDPVAQIDVGNFIKSPVDGFLEENDPYEFNSDKIHRKTYNDFGSLMGKNSNEKVGEDENYSYMETDNLQESPSSSILDNNINNEYNRHYQEKKCVLKNMKLPFFSHKKSATTKAKKNKKRKLFNALGNDKVISKTIDDNPAKQNSIQEKQNSYSYNYVNKRSYIERLCPACRRKFVSKYKKAKDNYNNQLNHNDVTYTDLFSVEGKTQNIITANSDYINIKDKLNIVKQDYEDSIDDRRSKREDDNRNIERQKELEDLEKRVESVTVNSSPSGG